MQMVAMLLKHMNGDASVQLMGVGYLKMLPAQRYPAINKLAGVVHWLKHSKEEENVDWVVILDADQIVRGPILPWDLGAEKGRPVAAYYGSTRIATSPQRLITCAWNGPTAWRIICMHRD